MNALVDTNLLSKFVFPDKNDRESRRLVRFVLRRYTVQHNIVSLVEYARNLGLPDHKQRTLHQLIGQNPIVPNHADWRRSHYLLLEWAEKHGRPDKDKRRKMRMDCLIAAMALNRNFAVITRDKDFIDLRNTRDGHRLHVVDLKTSE